MSEIQGKPVYGICECKEQVQVLSVEQVADLIQQMAANNWQVPENYIPKTSVNGVIEQNNKDEIVFWRGTQAKYETLTAEEKAMYTPIITDDTKYNELETKQSQHEQSIENADKAINQIINGTVSVGEAVNAKTVNNVEITKDGNGVLRVGDIIIPQEKILFNTPATLKEGTTYTLSSSVQAGDHLKFKLSCDGIVFWADLTVPTINSGLSTLLMHVAGTGYMFEAYMLFTSNTIFKFDGYAPYPDSANYSVDALGIKIEKVYKVIE